MKRNIRFLHSKWQHYLAQRKFRYYVLMLVAGIILYILPHLFWKNDGNLIHILNKIDEIFITVSVILIANSILLAFLDFYSTTDKNRSHPLQGLIQGLQVALFFIGGIIAVSIIIGKSPTVLLTGLGASAAVLMLIFKDSILGFVAGVQLSQNNMIRLGDWIQMPDGSANGTVEEITLNTVKVRNWDNTLSMIPPYTLVTTPFKNWRGMQESGGRRADKNILIDANSLQICTPEMLADIRKAVPLIDKYLGETSGLASGKASPGSADEALTNIQLYRIYIEQYLKNNPKVNQDLDLIVTQKEATAYGLPVEVYFFTREKTWAVYEQQQSDIFAHLLAIAPAFHLRLYQRP